MSYDKNKGAIKLRTPGVKSPVPQPASERGASTNIEIDRHPITTHSSGQKKRVTRVTEETHPTRGDVVRK